MNLVAKNVVVCALKNKEGVVDRHCIKILCRNCRAEVDDDCYTVSSFDDLIVSFDGYVYDRMLLRNDAMIVTFLKEWNCICGKGKIEKR